MDATRSEDVRPRVYARAASMDGAGIELTGDVDMLPDDVDIDDFRSDHDVTRYPAGAFVATVAPYTPPDVEVRAPAEVKRDPYPL